jgi:uncharacterized protein YceK
MRTSTLRRSAISAASLWLAGCSTPHAGHSGPPEAYQDTRLQYAILTEDRETLRKDFQTNPDRTGLERGLTAVTLPFAAVGETLFWPAFYGLTYKSE